MRNKKPKKGAKELIVAEIGKLRSLKAVSSTYPALYGAAVRMIGSWKKALKAAGISKIQ